jgi:ubiquinone/menaquinone biosynthesis C-methylase UbiE
MSEHDHWEGVYRNKSAVDVSWYQPHLAGSLELIDRCGLAKDGAIIDVGGGASSLVDDLLDRGHSNLTVLDLSESALEQSKQRLGERAERVRWVCDDITRVELPPAFFSLWHDRAVFHFLTEPRARTAYLEQVRRAVEKGGHVIVATFGPRGPDQCSGLPVMRYDADELHDEFGNAFELVRHTEERHVTPWGSLQEFVYCWCVKQV